MKRIFLLCCLGLLVFGGWPRVVAARNGAIHEHAEGARRAFAGDPNATQIPAPIGFNGGDFADGGRSPFGQ